MTIKLQKLLSIVLFACGAGAISLAAPAHAEYCKNEGNQAWCGGGNNARNTLDQMSCTPFAYKPWSYNNAKGLGTNKNSFLHDRNGQRRSWWAISISGLDV